MRQIEAIFRGGVFEPLEPVTLEENARVRLSFVLASEKPSWQEWLREANRVRDQIQKEHGVLPDSTPDIAEDRRR